MKFTKLVMAFALSMLVTGVYAQTRDEIAVKMNAAGEAMNAKNYKDASEKFAEAYKMIQSSTDEAAIEIEPEAIKNLGYALRGYGMTLAQAKDYENAITQFEDAIKYFKLGANIQMQRNVENLIVSCYQYEANEMVKLKKYDEAAAICVAAIKENPQATKLMLLAAQCYNKSNKPAEAVAMYEKVIELGNKTPRLKSDGNKAQEMLVEGLIADATKLAAAKSYTAAIQKVDSAEKYAKTADTQSLKMSIYGQAKDNNSIVKFGPAAANAQTDASKKSDINFMVGASYVALGDNAKALEYYKKVTTGKYLETAKTQITDIEKNLAATK